MKTNTQNSNWFAASGGDQSTPIPDSLRTGTQPRIGRSGYQQSSAVIRWYRVLLIALTALILPATKAMADLVVTPVSAGGGATLVNSILGSGVSVVSGSIVYNGADGQAGLFTGGTSVGIGIDTGIILSTGQAAIAIGPNDSGSAGTTAGLPGNPTLGPNGNDANTLTFRFTTEGGDLFFNFVFASEEYNEFVNQGFSDRFGFFLGRVHTN